MSCLRQNCPSKAPEALNPGRSHPIGTGRFRYVPSFSLQPDSGLLRCIPVRSNSKVGEICPAKNRPESGCNPSKKIIKHNKKVMIIVAFQSDYLII